MSVPQKDIDAFWRWFQARQSDFDALNDSSDAFWDETLTHLKQFDDRLWFELSEPNDDDREFIITAEGHTDIFPIVDEIVATAPRLQGWRFIALKPPMGFDFVTTYEGVRFNPRDMWFLPLESASRPRDLGIRVGVPDFSPKNKRQAGNAVDVILDTALGERVAALEIQHVEVGPLPKNPDKEGYIELTDLPKYIEWRKRYSKKSKESL